MFKQTTVPADLQAEYLITEKQKKKGTIDGLNITERL
jgi:hypothetical protein